MGLKSLGFLLSVTLAASVQAADLPITEHTLDNGMKVIIKEDHRAPIAVSQVWYRVGASYEPNGITGISHALEHMMFKGTKENGPNRFSEQIAEQGGSENAFTGRDYTAYFQTLASDRLEIAFKLESDRMRNLLLDGNEFAKEIKVIQEERRLRTEDQPKSMAYELFNATAYRVSPYRNPVIGWAQDLEQMKVTDLRAWYQRWYVPNNAILVVVGDVKPDEILQLAQQYYGVLPSSTLPEFKQERETAQRGQIRMQVKIPALQPYLLMGYKTPVINRVDEEWEPYALEMLVAILSSGDSSRISRDIIRGREIAVSADADYSAFTRLSGMLMLDAVPAKGYTIADVETALLAQIELLKTRPVSEQELARVRNQLLAAKVYERDSVFYQAMQIGMLEAMGMDWRLAEHYVDRMREVTAEQVMQVAKKYLREENLTVAELVPQPMEKRKSPENPMSLGARHVN